MNYSAPMTLATRQGLVVAGDLSDSLSSIRRVRPTSLGFDADPVKAISRILRDDSVDQLNIVAHGAPGSINLGTGLNKDILVANQGEIAEWNVKEIVLWSCDVSQDKDFVALLEEFTGAKVIASQQKLGLGNTIPNTGFDELANIVAGLNFELHTNTVGFDVTPGDTNGTFDVTLYYGSWHTHAPAEGALSLFKLAEGGDSTNWSDYSVEAYGRGGVISDDTFKFSKSNNSPSGNIQLNLENDNSGASYSPDAVNQAGFIYGQTYFHDSDVQGALDPNYQLTQSGSTSFPGRTYEHQQATVENVVPGSYRADYDQNPVGATPKSNLTVTYTPASSIQQMVFSLDSSGGISLGAESADVSVQEGAISEPLDLDDKVDGENYTITLGSFDLIETSGIDSALIGNPVQFDSDTNVYTVDVSTGYDFLNASDQVVATQNYTVSSDDAEDVTGTIEVKISGAEDISTITGVPSDVITLTPSQLTATGDLDLTDLDRTDSTFNTIPLTLPDNGNFVIDGDGNWDFTVSLQELEALVNSGSPTYSETVVVETLDSAYATLNFELVGNRDPIAVPDYVSIGAGSSKSFDVVGNDSDPDAHDDGLLTLGSISSVSNPNLGASESNGLMLIDASDFADMLPGSENISASIDYAVEDTFGAFDLGSVFVEITSPEADGSLITTSLADFDSSSFDLHSSIIGINDAAVDVDGTATVQTPVVLNSDSSASVVAGDAKAVADTTSIEGITDSSFAIASDLEMAASVQSSLDSTASSTDGIAVSNSLIGAQQGIELADVASVDAIDVGGIANITVGSSMSAASSADTVGDGSGNSGSLGVDGSWANTIADAHLGLGSGDLGGILGIDVASDAGISSSLGSVLSAEATADAGVAVSNAALNASTGMEDLQVEVGGLGLVNSINQSELASTASSTTDGASAIGLNDLASGILNSDFNFSDVDSVMSAQTISGLEVEASTTTGDAWSSLDSASVGFEGATSSITGAAEITAIATDQGFAESSTVSGQATALADQSAIGMDGYSISNSSDLQLSALAEVDSSADSSATMS